MGLDRNGWQVVRARQEHFESLSEWLDPTVVGWTPAELFEKLGKPGYHFSVMVRQPGIDVDAFLLAQTVLDETTLLAIAVRPECRRAGLGHHLVDDLVERAKAADSKSVFLEVRESNAGAIAFYKSLQFVQVGKRKNYYSVPENNNETVASNLTKKPREDALLFRLTL